MLKRYATPMYNESPLPHGTMNTFAYDGISDYTDKEFEGAVNWQHGFFWDIQMNKGMIMKYETSKGTSKLQWHVLNNNL